MISTASNEYCRYGAKSIVSIGILEQRHRYLEVGIVVIG